jgi:3-dehydroquinate dehydratase
MSKILVVRGPSLNLAGDRETEHYGPAPLIEPIHAAKSNETAYIILNPAAFMRAQRS